VDLLTSAAQFCLDSLTTLETNLSWIETLPGLDTAPLCDLPTGCLRLLYRAVCDLLRNSCCAGRLPRATWPRFARLRKEWARAASLQESCGKVPLTYTLPGLLGRNCSQQRLQIFMKSWAMCRTRQYRAGTLLPRGCSGARRRDDKIQPPRSISGATNAFSFLSEISNRSPSLCATKSIPVPLGMSHQRWRGLEVLLRSCPLSARVNCPRLPHVGCGQIS
jgi:hypothetical protein